tara:strand:+ start:80 stop:517 length:438 start_codon:yes stop_codon:yes gene_type:complete
MSIHKKDENDKKDTLKFYTNAKHVDYPKPPVILQTGIIEDGSDMKKKTLLVHETFHGSDSDGNAFVSENFGFYIKIGNFKKNKFQGQGNANKLAYGTIRYDHKMISSIEEKKYDIWDNQDYYTYKENTYVKPDETLDNKEKKYND